MADTIKVRLTRPMRTQLSNIILPAGAVGEVIELNQTRGLAVLFVGLSFSQFIPPSAIGDYAEFINGEVSNA